MKGAKRRALRKLMKAERLLSQAYEALHKAAEQAPIASSIGDAVAHLRADVATLRREVQGNE